MAKRHSTARTNYSTQKNSHSLENATRRVRLFANDIVDLTSFNAITDRRLIPRELNNFVNSDITIPTLRSVVNAKTYQQVNQFSIRNFGREAFSRPQTALVCVRRRARRRVLFALNRAGSGSTRPHHKWINSSYIKC